MNNLSAFKSYDIRGVRQEEIDEAFGLQMGYGLGKYLIEQYWTYPRILITADVRKANLSLIDNVLRWFKTAGIEQVENFGTWDQYPEYRYGICSTSLSYHLAMGEMDCCIIFSASHNSKEYVGMKIVDKEITYIKTSLLKELFLSISSEQVYDNNLCRIVYHKSKKIDSLFVELQNKFSTLQNIPHITIDYWNGAWVHYEQDFLSKIEKNFDHLFTNPDSDFSNHETDTSRFNNYTQLIETIRENGNDFWFMFDGDVDRCGMCLPNWSVVTWDVILAIIAKQLLESGDADKMGSREVFQEVFCSRVVWDVVKKYGWNLHIVRVWRWAFVDEVIEKNGLIAWETSAHILFKEYGTIEMPLLVLYYILKERSLFASASDMIAAYMPYVRGQILHFYCVDKDAIIEATKEQYSQYPQLTIDGVRVEWPDRWFTVRKSGTEPIIKVGLEAKDQASYDNLWKEIRAFLIGLWAHEE